MRLGAGWWLVLLALLAAVLVVATPLRAAEPTSSFTDIDILGRPAPYWRVDSASLRFTHFDQDGTGFQSRAGTVSGPGSSRLWVEQPQIELVLKQGPHLTHRIWLPVDIVTAASPDAVDVVSKASRQNEAGSFDWTATYSGAGKSQLFIHNAFHSEENYRSWSTGLGGAYGLADDNTVLSASVNETIDWFDVYLFSGKHNGHSSRSSTTFSGGVTQLLSPTTVAHLDYGITAQEGQLSNTWNIVPLADATRGIEIMPRLRQRHALVGRLAQWLPWSGALKGFYRLYLDDWGIEAHTAEIELYQRLASFAYVRLSYRLHHQTAPDFFTTRAPKAPAIRTADSDLAELWAQTFGIKAALDLPTRRLRNLHVDVAVERYFRSNDLRVSVFSCGLGLLF